MLEFQNLLRGLRARDEKAAEEVVRLYEPIIRRVARMRLRGAEARRVVDSLDICQSIMATFFDQVPRGAFDLDTPQQLRNLLVKMAVNKVIDKIRHEQRNVGDLASQGEPASAESAPSELIARQDLLDAVRARLTEKERHVFDQRALGRTWPQIAADTGEPSDALRMLHARAVARVRREMGGEEPCNRR